MSIIQFMQQEQEEKQTGQVLDYISPSRLSLWMKCPLAFRRRYVEGFQTAPSPALFVGKITHSVLAHIYRLRKAGQECTQDNLPMLVADAWKFGMETEPPFFENDAEEEKSRYQILDLVQAYLSAIPVQEEKPIVIEQRYEVPLIDLTTRENLGIPLVGVLDLVLNEECGQVIVDFKTSSTASISDLAHEIQLTALSERYHVFLCVIGNNELKGKTVKKVLHNIITCHQLSHESPQAGVPRTRGLDR